MDGFLNALKPQGLTSHDVASKVRRFLGGTKVGHLGTLDPMARGILPLALGRYTRLSEYLLEENREYLAEFIFGVRTDTCDLEGAITFRNPISSLKSSDVTQGITGFKGILRQTPPMYSAVRVKGQRLHRLARQGIKVTAPEREVRVSKFELLHWKPGKFPRGIFGLEVGRGTYVRSIARDLGDALGCGAAVSYLLRTRVGAFFLKDALPLESLCKKLEGAPSVVSLPPGKVFEGFSLFEIKPEFLPSIVHGKGLEPRAFFEPEGVEVWLKESARGPERNKRVFFGTYANPMTRRQEIACVLSLTAEGKEPNKIKYEKVLLREEW